MLTIGTTLKHYKRKDIQVALIDHTKDREVAARFNDAFGTRPDVLQYNSDVLEFAKQGATSFHCSEERWHNPLQLVPGMKLREMDELRSGWDLVIDVDCKNWEYSKLITHLVVQLIRGFGINAVTVKFSGNKGFHIGVPFEALPQKIHGKETRLLFPEGPRRIATYLIQLLGERFLELLPQKNTNDIAKTLNVNPDELVHTICIHCKTKHIMREEKYLFICHSCENQKMTKENLKYLNCEKCSKIMVKHDYNLDFCFVCGKRDFKQTLNIAKIMEIDTLLISSRHLYRAPYSLHEKSGLVSIPISIETILTFDKATAHPDVIKTILPFMPRTASPEEARQLLIAAFDATLPQQEKTKEFASAIEIPATAISEQNFPPCIKKIAQGLEDGKKRAVFILINFLRNVGWTPDQIEQYLIEWNKRNPEPLRENYLVGQLRYTKTKKAILPPNCNNTSSYQSMGLKCPESICSRCKNPVNHAKRMARMSQTNEKEKGKKNGEKKEKGKKVEEPLNTKKDMV